MARVNLLLQGFCDDGSHRQALLNLLEFENLKRFIACSAFVREDGVNTIRDQLAKISRLSTAYIGIRNGVTSIQGIIALLKTGISLYTVDTGSLSILYHPKIYCSYNESKAITLIGSANLTYSGLINNIEAGAFVELDLMEQDDKDFLEKLADSFDDLPHRFPEHVVPLRSIKDAIKLLREGRITDERFELNASKGYIKSKQTTKIRRIDIPFHYRKKTTGRIKKDTTILKKIEAGPESFDLVWILPSLKRRHLQIPTGNTNPTGSLSLGKGAMTDIDQTTYFREVVFKELSWSRSPFDPDKETSSAMFEVVIAGISYGSFSLLISHNPRFESGQRNYTSSIHWGEVKNVIAREDLLDRELRLFKNRNKVNEFIIEID